MSQQIYYRQHRNKQLAQGHSKRDTLQRLYPASREPWFCCEFCREFHHYVNTDIFEGLAYDTFCIQIVKALSLGEGIN